MSSGEDEVGRCLLEEDFVVEEDVRLDNGDVDAGFWFRLRRRDRLLVESEVLLSSVVVDCVEERLLRRSDISGEPRIPGLLDSLRRRRLEMAL